MDLIYFNLSLLSKYFAHSLKDLISKKLARDPSEKKCLKFSLICYIFKKIVQKLHCKGRVTREPLSSSKIAVHFVKAVYRPNAWSTITRIQYF